MGSSCKQTHKHLAIEIILHGEVVKVFTALMSETGGQLYKMSTRSNFCYRGQYQLLMPWVYLLFPQHTITSIDNFVEYTTEKAHFFLCSHLKYITFIHTYSLMKKIKIKTEDLILLLLLHYYSASGEMLLKTQKHHR